MQNRMVCIIICLAMISGMHCVFAETIEEPSQPEKDQQYSDTGLVPADEFLIPYADLSIDELLNLRDEIDRALVYKGYNPYYSIERADKGEAVVRVQNRLKELGYYDGSVTGKMDNATQKAMKQFEKANSLENDGLPSREDQLLLFSEGAIPNTMNNNETSKANAESIEKEIEEIQYADYGKLDYEDCFRYPEKHRGEKVVIKGTVVQVLGSRTSGFQLRVAINGSSSDIVYVYVLFDPGYNILENDRVTIYATMNETITYISIWNQSITIPAAIADSIALR